MNPAQNPVDVWIDRSDRYRRQRDVLQSELDHTRAALAAESGHVERLRTANLEFADDLDHVRDHLAHRTADLDAVVAERDAALERVAELEDEREQLRTSIADEFREHRAARARIAELEEQRLGALELHRPKSGNIGPECTACGAEDDPEPWPCSTMLVLDYSRDLSDR